MSMKEGSILAIGNPLLDITAHVDDEFLKKYGLPKSGAILAEVKHDALYEDLINKFEIEYTAGGAAQNTMRFCQFILGKNNAVTVFLGCIGNDYFGKIMEKKAKSDGVNVKYQVEDNQSTGTCAVLITDGGKQRSLCAYLGASEKFHKEFVIRNWTLVEKAQVYFTTGHALAVSAESAMEVAKHCHEWGKDFMFNIAAAYVSHKYSRQLMELLPYVDYFFGNAEEVQALATVKGYHSKEPKEVAKLIANEPKIKYNNPKIPREYKNTRIVVVTQGSNPVIVARTGSNNIQEFPVPAIPEEKIVDVNGAGDAFTGGFLAMYIQGKPFEVCIKCAIYCATECIQLSGATFPRTNNFKP